MSNCDGDIGFGGFELAGMELALPMGALREVMPFAECRPLPCPAPCVMGGIEVRGAVIPVVDLRIVLGLPTPAIDLPCVIIMLHEGKVLGLLAEKVTGIFAGAAERQSRVSAIDGIAGILFGGVRRADTQQLVSVLAPAALAAIPQVPLLDDPEPARRVAQGNEQQEGPAVDEPAVPMLLVRCGHVPLALEAMTVHATISQPDIQPSVLASGSCQGVIAYAGMKVPAIDLLMLCGMGRLPADQAQQAFIVLLPSGYVAFLVNEVLDVVRTLASDLMSVPAFALPVKGLFAGAISASALPTDVSTRPGMAANQFLVIDAVGLRTHEEVQSMAAANAPWVSLGGTATPPAIGSASKPSQDATSQRSEGGRLREVITYDLGTETASPLSQIVEILPHSPDIATFQGGAAMMGLQVHHGRSIPVFCLGRLTTGAEPALTQQTSVLIVEVDDQRIGFSVPRLRSIEATSWEPELAHSGVLTPGQRAASQKLALIGAVGGAPGRMLPVVDLHSLAQGLLQGSV